MELSDEARRNILEEPLAEIARLLEHNLLDKFKQMRERQIRETGVFVYSKSIYFYSIFDCVRVKFTYIRAHTCMCASKAVRF